MIALRTAVGGERRSVRTKQGTYRSGTRHQRVPAMKALMSGTAVVGSNSPRTFRERGDGNRENVTGYRGDVGSFESVAGEYDTARPSYPAEVFDALGTLDGLRVLDIGAGTGIATRALLERCKDVVAIDTGPAVLRRAAARTPGLIATIADGAALPVRSGATDLVCFAQAWHWLDPTRRVREMHRVLRSGGRWAGWWSHARADEEPWFDRYWRAIESACPGTHRDQRDTDWGTTIEVSGHFVVEDRVTVPWTRHISVDDWITDQASHSYIAGLTPDKRVKLLGTLRAVLDEAFSDGAMSVRYETRLWIATRT